MTDFEMMKKIFARWTNQETAYNSAIIGKKYCHNNGKTVDSIQIENLQYDGAILLFYFDENGKLIDFE